MTQPAHNLMVTPFLRQTAALERRTGTSAYTGNTYTTPETIRVRWYSQETVLRFDDGREVISDAHISTRAAITEGDRITDERGRAREIVRVRRNRDTRGAFSHWVGYLA